MAERNHKGMLKEWELNLSRPASTDPECCQVCIDGMASFMQPVLDLVVEFTGMPATLLMGGLEPAAKGRMNIIALHSGVTKGPVKMNFGEAKREGFHSKVVPVFSDFLRKCFTREDGKAAVLPVESVPLMSILDPKEVTYCAASGDNFGSSPEPSPAPNDPPARGGPKKVLKKPVKDTRGGGRGDPAPRKKKSRFDNEGQTDEEEEEGDRGAVDSDDEGLDNPFTSSTRGTSHEPSQKPASEASAPKKPSKKSSSKHQVAAQKRPTGQRGGGRGKGKQRQVDEESQTEEVDVDAADSDDEALLARCVTPPPPAPPSPTWTAGSRPSPPASSPLPLRSALAGREDSVIPSKPQEREVAVDAPVRSSSPTTHAASKAPHIAAAGAKSSSAETPSASKPVASPTASSQPTVDDAKLGRGNAGRSSKRKGDGDLEVESTKCRKESDEGSGGHGDKRKADEARIRSNASIAAASDSLEKKTGWRYIRLHHV
ncbi:hypothetical protein GALMADRAFT_205925 [Galerina marginata CBS 339.88]|uniref:Uncharacterized protein n=1 Tax=Galerina marginata (strain CBS 339.88) TaxID=685588 RepID=A0A067TPF5_GALM3|nr:hypothetical protein GALMADRAFT_205925 [Galerina marginata CBS 339.88]